MSQQNPVPPQGPPFGGPPAPGQPGGQGGFGQAGQGGFGTAPPGDPGAGAPEEVAPQKKGGAGKKIISIVAAIVIAAGIYGAKQFFGGDKTADAKAGDCIADPNALPVGSETTDSDAKVVDCTSADAKFVVVGRVANKTEAQFKADNSGELKLCVEAGFPAEYMSWKGVSGGNGYLLCLNEKK